ncbi:MAG: Ig-like domain-containing protein, partial [Deltaproteobacteria bacterium]|nr:Ig-like domain-containing protein [Deltaproteobacteria bacterium]
TGDTGPPSLVSMSPANGAINVDTASVLRLTFSEPVTQASLSGALSLTYETGGGTVTGTLAPVTGFGGRVWAFAPDALLTDRTYRVEIAASVADLVGNVTAAPVTTRFSTTDTLAPEISGLSTMDGASLVAGTTVPVTAEASDGTGVARVEFFVGDALFATDIGTPFVFGLNLLPEYGDEIIISAIAYDASGNRSEREYLTVSILENQAPTVEISSPENGGETGLGQIVNVTVDVSDDVGAASVTLTAAGGSLFAKTTAVPSGAGSVSFSFTVPEDWDRAIPCRRTGTGRFPSPFTPRPLTAWGFQPTRATWFFRWLTIFLLR